MQNQPNSQQISQLLQQHEAKSNSNNAQDQLLKQIQSFMNNHQQQKAGAQTPQNQHVSPLLKNLEAPGNQGQQSNIFQKKDALTPKLTGMMATNNNMRCPTLNKPKMA